MFDRDIFRETNTNLEELKNIVKLRSLWTN